MAKDKLSLAKDALENVISFEDENESAEDALLESNNFLNEELITHTKVKSTFVGNLTEFKKGFAKVVLQTTHDMIVDEFGLIHSGFIFGAAEYAAVASINEENIIVIGCRAKFFAPAKLGDFIEFEAKGRFEEARKREIKVIGRINDIKVFEGIFHAILLEKHILKVNPTELQANFNSKNF